METLALGNGIQAVVVYFPGSTNLSIFSFLPLGLASDGPDQTQWSHLIEHLVIRSTIPANSPQANAETLPDHMRLDFYGHLGNWKEGLAHHRRWLEGVPFTEANLTLEKPKVTAEGDFTARNLATHKFAIGAWSQGIRHGKKHVAVKGDVLGAGLAAVQRLRDERLVLSNQVTVCMVGGLEPKQALAELQKQFSNLLLPSASAPPSANAKIAPGSLKLTWDLDARHLLLAWPIPGSRHQDYAPLMAAGPCLNMLLASDATLARQTGMTFAGADLATPEGSWFYVSASLRPGATFEAVQKTILASIGRLSAGNSLAQVSLIGRQLSTSLTKVPDLKLIQAQAPPRMAPAMIEGNIGLQLGMHVHRFGAYRETLARQLADITPRQVQDALRNYLSAEKLVGCAIEPAAAALKP